jgi:hypothetical protein
MMCAVVVPAFIIQTPPRLGLSGSPVEVVVAPGTDAPAGTANKAGMIGIMRFILVPPLKRIVVRRQTYRLAGGTMPFMRA